MKNQKNITSCLNSISGYTKSYFILNKTFINPILFFKNYDSVLIPIKIEDKKLFQTKSYNFKTR